MSLTLTVVEPANLGPAYEVSRDLIHGSLTIGRSDPECSAFEGVSVWFLPDETNRVSRKHCRIFRKNDAYFIIDDRSTNGTFLNGRQILENVPEKLQHDDQIKLCDDPPVYELRVSIQKPDIGTNRKKAPWKKEKQDRETRGKEEQSVLEPVKKPRKWSPFKKQSPISGDIRNDTSKKENSHEVNNCNELQAEETIQLSTAVDNSSNKLQLKEAIQLFTTGAGLKIEADDDLLADAFFLALGRAFREAIKGVLELLEVRDEEKEKLRIPRTTEIGGPQTNLLKAIIYEKMQKEDKVEQAIKLLLSPRDSRHLNAQKALEEAFLDIKAHELATLNALNAGLARLLERFDPKKLEQEIEARSGLQKYWRTHKKASQWDAYTQLYDEIAKEARDDFQKLFQGRFREAYEDTVKKFKDH